MTPVPHLLTTPSLLLKPRNATGPAAPWTRMEEAGHPEGITWNPTPDPGTRDAAPDADEQRWDTDGGDAQTSSS